MAADQASHQRRRGRGDRGLPLPSPQPLLSLGFIEEERAVPPGAQSLSDPTAEDPFRFRLVGFGFVSSSSEALLEPDSSSALGG